MLNKAIATKKADTPQSTSVSVSATTSSGAASDLGKAEDAVHASGDIGIMALAVRKDTAGSTAADGDYHPIEVDSSGRLWVNLGASALLPASLGTKTAAASLAVTLASDEGLLTRIGEVQASPTSNTVLDRLKTLNTTLVSASPRGTAWNYAAAIGGISNTTTAVTIKAADASLRNYLSTLQISSDPLGAATEFTVRDGAGGTVLWRMKIGTAGIVNGFHITFDPPLFSTAATLLEVVTLTASVTGGVFVNAQGFVAA